MNDDALVAAMGVEMAARNDGPLTFVLRPESALHIAGLLQLALRHPGLSESNRYAGRTFVEHVRAYFADAPAVLEVLRRGDDPRHDT